MFKACIFPLESRTAIATLINSGIKSPLVANQTPLLPSHLFGPPQTSPSSPGWVWAYSKGHLLYHHEVPCTKHPFSTLNKKAYHAQAGSHHRAKPETHLPPSPFIPLLRFAAKEERWQMGTHPMQQLLSAVQTLLNTVLCKETEGIFWQQRYCCSWLKREGDYTT